MEKGKSKNLKHEAPKKDKQIEREGKKSLNIILLIIFCLILGLGIFYNLVPMANKGKINTLSLKKEIKSIKNSTTIEGEKLVFKSTSGNTRIMEYTFENNVLNKVKMYEQFKDEEIFNKTKENYQKRDGKDIDILNINEEEKSIEIEKKDFGSDTGKSYEETADKYLVQIIGAYEKI